MPQSTMRRRRRTNLSRVTRKAKKMREKRRIEYERLMNLFTANGTLPVEEQTVDTVEHIVVKLEPEYVFSALKQEVEQEPNDIDFVECKIEPTECQMEETNVIVKSEYKDIEIVEIEEHGVVGRSDTRVGDYVQKQESSDLSDTQDRTPRIAAESNTSQIREDKSDNNDSLSETDTCVCNICDQSYKAEYSHTCDLDSNVHSGDTLTCQFCNLQFDSKRILNLHEKNHKEYREIHTGQRIYVINL